MKIFNLPDLGEGLAEAEIHEWHVKVGDAVEVDQDLVSMETAKAVVEVPSPVKGKVVKLYGEPGDIIDTGEPLIEFEVAETAEVEKSSAATVAGAIEVGDEVITEAATGVSVASSGGSNVKVMPAVRELAKSLGVDLEQVRATGKHGEITIEDVKNACGISAGKTTPTSIDQNMQPLHGVRRTMAQIMSQSHAQVVPVTLYDDADISSWAADEDITVRVMQAIAAACQQEPALNAHYDGKAIARNLIATVDLGVAMDSEDGLFVPVIQDVAGKSKTELRETINRYKTEVKERTVAPENLQGASITLSNFGTFAGKYASPIVVPPSVAIIGTGKLRQQAVVVDGEVVVHRVMPLSLTFDHRAATGGEASRFLGWLIGELEK